MGVTSDGSGPRELVVQTAGSRDGRLEELSARLDLREPAIRSRLGGRTPWNPAVAARAAPAGRHARSSSSAASTWSTTAPNSYSAVIRLGRALGLEHTRVDVRSRLADATVWIAGSGPRRRADCLGLP